MTACSQPGCTGNIVDGYCDVCGSPGASSPAAPPAGSVGLVGQFSGSVGQSGGPCGQSGCTGTVTDGYCDICGTPGAMPTQATGPRRAAPDFASGQATSQPPSAPVSGPSGGESPAAMNLSSRTVGSSQLASTALGSQRAVTTGSKITRRISSGSQRLRAARLGAGLTRVPPAPEVDASKAVMKDPSVPEDKRSCGKCGKPVGRARMGQPGRPEGFCPNCGQGFSFTPKLHAGDVVANQYEVAGCLAHGGLGWIYLAKDRNVSDRWVVLKGLLNTGDADALAVAIVEKQFLAQVEHPLIVEIYNFVTHDGANYIVMEYVGGTSLKQILKARMREAAGRYDALPVDQALAYILEVLPAFQYLHDLGLVYCDFKPDNLIQVGDAVKLIDLGGVRRIDDQVSAIYGTVGYQAPEVAQVGTTVASDIYTIGRTLVVLMMEFRGYQTKYVGSLPPIDEMPLFQQHDSLYRLVAKACAPDPADRFASIDELRVQLLGVLREVVAEKVSGAAFTSAASVLFEAPAISSDILEWDGLPALRHDTTDPQYAWLSNLPVDSPQARLEALGPAPESTPEVQLARAKVGLELGRADVVDHVVNQMLTEDPWEWRAVWMSGLLALQKNDFPAAQKAFNAVYGQVPGELAPKLALAIACERGGQAALAERLYATCASTDANYVAPSSFGRARIRAAAGDIDGAVAALDQVPSTSRGYLESRRQRASALYRSNRGLPSLAQAMDSVSGVKLAPLELAEMTAQILEKALAEIIKTGPKQNVRIGPYAATDIELRDGLELTYRQLAAAEDNHQARIALVDRANAVRRWTLQ